MLTATRKKTKLEQGDFISTQCDTFGVTFRITRNGEELSIPGLGSNFLIPTDAVGAQRIVMMLAATHLLTPTVKQAFTITTVYEMQCQK
jgi:hypothetical protein